MKEKERSKARKLRKQGRSIREIALELSCAKSSVSAWVNDIPLNFDQIERLKTKQDRGRAHAANHPNSPKHVWATIRTAIAEQSYKDIPSQSSKEILMIVGSALYWAEGYKYAVNMISFSNSDPGMVSVMMRFFRDVCGVPEEKFRGILHIHPQLNVRKAERFWSKISGIPLRQFHKTQCGVSKASKQKKDSLPLGTFGIVVCDTRLRARIDGWIQGIRSWGNVRAVGAIG